MIEYKTLTSSTSFQQSMHTGYSHLLCDTVVLTRYRPAAYYLFKQGGENVIGKLHNGQFKWNIVNFQVLIVANVPH